MKFDRDGKYSNTLLLVPEEMHGASLRDWEQTCKIISMNVRERIPEEYLDRVKVTQTPSMIRWEYE